MINAQDAAATDRHIFAVDQDRPTADRLTADLDTDSSSTANISAASSFIVSREGKD